MKPMNKLEGKIALIPGGNSGDWPLPPRRETVVNEGAYVFHTGAGRALSWSRG